MILLHFEEKSLLLLSRLGSQKLEESIVVHLVVDEGALYLLSGDAVVEEDFVVDSS